MPKKRSTKYNKRRRKSKSYRKSNKKTKRRKKRSGKIRRINKVKLSGRRHLQVGGVPGVSCLDMAKKVKNCHNKIYGAGADLAPNEEACGLIIRTCGPLCQKGHILIPYERPDAGDRERYAILIGRARRLAVQTKAPYTPPPFLATYGVFCDICDEDKKTKWRCADGCDYDVCPQCYSEFSGETIDPAEGGD